MSKLYVNGEPVSSSVNYASAISCIDKDGNKSTVQAEINNHANSINQLNLELDNLDTYTTYTMYGMKFIKNGKHVNIYGSLTDLDGNAANITLGTIENCIPINTWAVIPLYSTAPPYTVIGTMWISSTGATTLYKPGATTTGYVSGSYMCKD